MVIQIKYKIITKYGNFKFIGRYCRELETSHWHYYERDDGIVLHFRKEHMVCVIGDTVQSVLNKRKHTYNQSLQPTEKHGG